MVRSRAPVHLQHAADRLRVELQRGAARVVAPQRDHELIEQSGEVHIPALTRLGEDPQAEVHPALSGGEHPPEPGKRVAVVEHVGLACLRRGLVDHPVGTAGHSGTAGIVHRETLAACNHRVRPIRTCDQLRAVAHRALPSCGGDLDAARPRLDIANRCLFVYDCARRDGSLQHRGVELRPLDRVAVRRHVVDRAVDRDRPVEAPLPVDERLRRSELDAPLALQRLEGPHRAQDLQSARVDEVAADLLPREARPLQEHGPQPVTREGPRQRAPGGAAPGDQHIHLLCDRHERESGAPVEHVRHDRSHEVPVRTGLGGARRPSRTRPARLRRCPARTPPRTRCSRSRRAGRGPPRPSPGCAPSARVAGSGRRRGDRAPRALRTRWINGSVRLPS